jgi:hypothetical protein
MHLNTIARAALRVAAALLLWSIAFAQSASTPPPAAAGAPSSAPFDGKWLTKMSCPAKGNTEGYTWQFASAIENGNFRGEHGTAGEPGYLLIEGKIAKDGSAKLSATGIVASRNYARGILAHKGADYGYDIKAKFQDAAGTGTRDAGLGIVGRPCTFDFTKQ